MKKNGILLLLITLVGLAPSSSVSADEAVMPTKTILLPFQTSGIDETSVRTSMSLLEGELLGYADIDLRPYSDGTENGCANALCALQIGQDQGVEEVIYGSMNALGEKIIIQYQVIDVATEKVILQDYTTSRNVEDLDTVMERVAMSIVSLKPFEKTAIVGVITETEEEVPNRRSSRKFTGFSFGYLYPTEGYDKVDDVVAVDFRYGYELDQAAVGIHLGIRKGFMAQVFGSYLLTKTDFCPYVGAGFGIHWINHDYYDYPDYYDYYGENEDKQTHGAELSFHTGVRAFRTYNFQVLLNFDYSRTFNDYDDEGFAVTIGLLGSSKRRH